MPLSILSELVETQIGQHLRILTSLNADKAIFYGEPKI